MSDEVNNIVIDTALAITYSKSRIQGQWTWSTSPVSTETRYEAYNYVRTATKSYRIVGLTYDEATSLAAEKRTMYTRSTKTSVLGTGEFTDESDGSVPMADVAASHVGGDLWEVVINVRETDSRLRFASVSAQSLFSAEDQRTYDE